MMGTFLHSTVPRTLCKRKFSVRTLDRYHNFECVDGQDRIAALNVLEGGLEFDIDYALSVEGNYVAFAAAIVLNGGEIPLIRSALLRKEHLYGKQRTLPSWVPDWRLPLQTARQLDEYPVLLTVEASHLGRDHVNRVDVSGTQLVIPSPRVRRISNAELAYVQIFNATDEHRREDFLDIQGSKNRYLCCEFRIKT